jgi:endonuclease YncB( thermonuclease family)
MRALTLAILLFATPALADVTGPARVIDGDSLEVQGQRIRLHGIDAPESSQICRLDGKPWQCGKDAANALAGKIARRPVTCEESDRDRYKRIIARCTVAGEDIGDWMVVNGWAVAYRRYSQDYIDEEAEAQAARHGIWASEFVKPWEWRRGKRLGSAAPEACTACDLRHKRLLKRSETGVPTTGPEGDTRPGPVCVWFAQKAGHDVAGYYEKVGAIGTRFMVGVQLNDGLRVNCVMELGLQRFTLIQLTEPFNAGSEIYGIVPIN